MRWRQLVSKFHRGKISRRASLQRESRRMAALASHASESGSRPRRPSRSIFLSEDGWPRLLEQERAMLFSQQGPMASVPLVSLPTDRVSKFESLPFRILLFRRLRLPLSLCLSLCAGVAVLWTPLATTVERARQQGFWTRRGWALESVAA